MILQRINLWLFAVLGELSATAAWRAISEEIWPFVHGPASTPMGEAEAAWQAAPGGLAMIAPTPHRRGSPHRRALRRPGATAGPGMRPPVRMKIHYLH